MYLKHVSSGDLVEVLNFPDLFDPFQDSVQGRIHAGEELQDPAVFAKADLVFPSGEALPRCWWDAGYRSQAAVR